MIDINPFFCTDGYKVDHHKQYPQNTTLVYSNFTPRSNKYAPKGCDKVVSFGQQMVFRQIQEIFEKNFFKREEIKAYFNKWNTEGNEVEDFYESTMNAFRNEVCGEIKKEYSLYLGKDYDVSHIEALWDLGYLPIKAKSLPEGSLVGMGVPVLTIYNTKPEFYWLTNFLETLISNLLWKPMTSATIANQYKTNLVSWALKTDKDNVGFVDFQGHDFSMRGLDSIDATISSGLGHATSFLGSDSLPVVKGAKKYYDEKGFVVGSVTATEHSVMAAGTKGNEIGTFRYLMNQFPTGILSIVSDTWDLWKVLTEYLPELKKEILSRDGKIVIRPDSGDPVDIICGTWNNKNSKEEYEHVEEKGVIELLWDIFGGTVNDQGYKCLDSHIGAIYGDSITLDRADEICSRLEAKGFASTNIVLGIGSFTYQFNTRDTFGFAMKATYVEISKEICEDICERAFLKEQDDKCNNGCNSGTLIEGREIFKDPITDDGTKKSAKGLLHVKDNGLGGFELVDQCNWEQENLGRLKTIFKDGNFYNQTTLTDIRNNLK
jgi:nicotinamide phosphoribosyltransferase